MKRFFAMLCLTVSALFILTACQNNPTEKVVLRVVLPDGAPVLAVYSMIENDEIIDGYKIEFNIVSSPDQVAVSLKKGEADIGVMPTNVAGKAYNGGVDIKLLSTNIFGVLYMVGKTDIENIAELKGKTVGLVGLGGTPDLTLKVLLDKEGVEYEVSDSKIQDKVALRYVTTSDTASLIGQLKSGALDYAILGEPQVTQCNLKAETHVIFDLLELWDNNFAKNCYMQAGVVITKNVSENPKLVNALENVLKDNYQVLSQNPQSIKDVIRAKGSSVGVDFTSETVSRLKIGYLSAQDSKAGLETYFNEIIKIQPAFIDKLPDEGFYY